VSALQRAPGLPADPSRALPGDLGKTAGKFDLAAHDQPVKPKRDRRLHDAIGQRTAHSPADQQIHQTFPHHPRKWRAQILPGARPGLQSSEEAEKRSAGLESRPPDARFISPAWDGVKVAETDAEGFAGTSVRQRPLAGAEEQLYGVLGDRGGETKGSFEEPPEVRGADYLGHHR
jgi:hypothetical protein